MRWRSSKRLVFVFACAGWLATSSHAYAADAGAGASADDIKSLEKQLSEEHAALSTSDCNAACRALGSIRRAAERICAIEPGPRCDVAREKAADATKRVHDACPDCALASGPMPPAPPPARAMEPQLGTDKASPANAPPSEERKGGCASCTSTEQGRGGLNADLGLVFLAAFGALRLFRRPRRKDR